MNLDVSRKAKPGTSIEVAVVDDARLFAEPLALAINSQPDMVCTTTSATLMEFFAGLDERGCPDIVLMDVQMPGEDGIEGTRRLVERCPDVRVIIVTGFADRTTMARAAAAGAAGVLPKDVGLDATLAALRSVWSAEGVLVERSALMRLADEDASVPADDVPDDGLTPRERQVLDLLAAGLEPKRIARELGLSVHTARGYVRSILQKLGAHSQLEAVVKAAERGWITRLDRDR